MARARQLNLSDFEATVEKMRELGVASWANSPVGDIILGPDPVRMKKTDKASTDPETQRRSYYTEVLGYPVSDAMLKKLP